MDFTTRVKVEVFDFIVETTRTPLVSEIAERMAAPREDVAAAYRTLGDEHVLVLGDDGEITMPSPFAARPTRFRVEVEGRTYFANCVWDALAIPAAMHKPGVVRTTCGYSDEPMTLEVGEDGPAERPWIAHFAVPAAHWRDDIFYT